MIPVLRRQFRQHRNIAGSSFVPTDLGATLVRWWKANVGAYSDTGTTLAVDSATVNQWNDQSGNASNIIQSTSGNRPTFKTSILNGLPVLRFDGAGDKLSASISAMSAQTAFIVLRKRSATAGNEGALEWANVSTIFANAAYGAAWQWYSANSGNVFSFGGDVQNWTTICVKFASTSSLTMYRNGSIVGSAVDPDDAYASATSLRIGEYESGTPDVDVAEILLCDSALSDGNRGSVDTYLQSKYAHY